MKTYELLYIIPSRFTDQEIDGIQSHIAALVEKNGGKISKQENLGKIKLAYPIARMTHGTYILVYLDAEPSVVVELNRQLKLEESILRHTLLIKPAGAEKRTFELSAYVPPLTDAPPGQKSTQAPSASVSRQAHPSVLPKKRMPAAPQVVAPVAVEPSTMTMEELDKKLDEILKDVDLPTDV